MVAPPAPPPVTDSGLLSATNGKVINDPSQKKKGKNDFMWTTDRVAGMASAQFFPLSILPCVYTPGTLHGAWKKNRCALLQLPVIPLLSSRQPIITAGALVLPAIVACALVTRSSR